MVNGEYVTALLDTGSMVSTMASSWCHSLGLQIQSLNNLLTVQSAGGHTIPYEGYVEVRFSIPQEEMTDMNVLMLVVPNTVYHDRVPILLGTNVLSYLRTQVRVKDSRWEAVLAMLARQEALVNTPDSLGSLIIGKPLTIPPNGRMVIQGHTRVKAVCQGITVCLDGSNGLPKGVLATPSVTTLPPGRKRTKLPVELVNHSAQTVTVPAKARVCDLYSTEDVTPLGPSSLPGVSGSSNIDMGKECFLTNFVGIRETLTEERVREVEDLLMKWRGVFSLHDMDLGLTDKVEHRIRLSDDVPFKEKPRPIPPSMFNEVRAHLKEMESLGVIRKSQSPYASNVVVVRKKSGAIRFCLDLRRLNSKTIPDRYSLPRIDTTLDILSGAKWFSVLDLKSGYWQVPLAEQDKNKTAFTVGPLGFWECERMPFGLTNAPATFQRLMESCMGDLHLSYCLLYLDDIVIYSKTYEDHLVRLEAVLQKLKDAGLKLSPSKCNFLQKKIKYLGHMISEQGISVDPEKVSCVKAWPLPKTVSEVQSFLGFTSFYRRFIKDFAKVAKPLHQVAQGGIHYQTKTRTRVRYPPLQWGSPQQQAFDKLKEMCSSTPVLGFADYNKPFILHTDASGDGLGAVLSQDQEGKKRVIAYASRNLAKAERNYAVHKLEFLALKWAVTEKFHDYLYGNEFSVVTDNNPLTYILKSAKLDATGHRWVAQLANYKFTLSYLPGSANRAADALSRINWPAISSEIVSQLLDVHLDTVNSVECFCYSQQGVPDSLVQDVVLQDYINWSVEQDQDPVIREVRLLLSKRLTEGNVSPGAKKLWKERKSLRIVGSLLTRTRMCSGEEQSQLVLPKKYWDVALRYVHDEMGHLGRDRSLELLRERYFWIGMHQSVADHIANCGRCIRRKDWNPQRAPLVNTVTSQPMELVCVDFLKLEPSQGGIENVLVVTDHFTKYAQAYATRNQTARTTARVLYENFFIHYGFPRRLHSDQGRNFESKMLRELCDMANIRKSRTTPYHPMGNGIAERFNSTLLNMLGTLDPKKKVDWKSHLGSLVHAYNCTKHDTTGFSPYYLMFGRHPHIPVDLALGWADEKAAGNTSDYVKEVRERLSKAFEIAEANASQSRADQKERYDRKVRGAFLTVGDRVLVRNVCFQGTHKIADRWSEEVYLVVKQPNSDIPVYEIKPESGNGRSKVLHRNLLLPLPKARSSVSDHDVETVTQREGTDSDSDSDLDSLVEVRNRQTPQREVPVPAPRVFGVLRSTDILPCATESSRVTGNILDERQRMSNLLQEHSNSGEGDVLSESTSTQDEVDDLIQTESNGDSGAENIAQATLNDHVSARDIVQVGTDNQVAVDDTTLSSVPSSAEFLSSPVPPRPAPRRSTRMRSTAHLRPDFVYNFQASSGGGQEIAKKVGFLKEVIKLFD